MRNHSVQILLVDDEPGILFMYSEILKPFGEITVAQSGDEAIQILGQAKRFALVVTDYQMEGGCGVEVLRYVEENLPDVPVILLTGDDRLLVAQKAVEHRAIAHVLKFAPREEFLRHVQRAILHGIRRRVESEERQRRADEEFLQAVRRYLREKEKEGDRRKNRD